MMHAVHLSRREILLFSGGVIVLLIAIYGRSLGNEFVFWDDPLLVIDNPISHGLSLKNILDAFSHYDPNLYVPLTFLSFQVNYSLASLHPFLYHLTNLILHAGSALLVGWVMLQLTGRKFDAAFVAFLFAVHPINVEAVAWVSARKDVLSAFFFHLSLAAYLRSRRGDAPRWYWLGVAAFLLGLLSKVSILMLPFILLLVDWYRTKAVTKVSLMRTAPFFLLSIVFGVVAVFGKLAGTRTLFEKFLVGMQAVPFTLRHLVWPFEYSVIYPFTGEPSFLRPDLLLPLAGVIAVCVLTVLLRRRFPSVFLGWWWFLLLLAPSFLTTEKGQDLVPELYLTSDRYAYLAAIGMFLIAARFLCLFGRRSERLPHVFAIVVLVPLFVLAFLQSLVWRNTETLLQHALARHPESSIAHNNLGVFYDAHGNADAAFREYEDAVRPSTHSIPPVQGLRPLRAERQGRPERSRVATSSPQASAGGGTGDAWFNYGMALAKRKDVPGAVAALRKAVELRPRYAIAHQNLGALLLDAGEIQSSVDHLLIAQSLDPRNVTIYLNLGMALEKGSDVIDAKRAYERALQLEPGNVFAKERLAHLP